MKAIPLILIILLLGSFTKKTFSGNKSTKWVFTDNSSLSVNGTTNISKFSCKIVKYPKTDTVIISQDKNNSIILNGSINIAVLNFNCSNYMMTKELRKTLKEDQYPYLHVKFLSLKEIPRANQKNSTICGQVEITIAGVSKRFEISYQLAMDNNSMKLLGTQAINFSDFNLTPPKKMGKLVRANDQLAVVFNLNLKAI